MLDDKMRFCLLGACCLIATALAACAEDAPMQINEVPLIPSIPVTSTAVFELTSTLPAPEPEISLAPGPGQTGELWVETPIQVEGNYLFAEGPAVDLEGNVYFSDITGGRIYKWTLEGNVAVFQEGLDLPNGLGFDTHGNLIVCEGGAGRLISIDMQGNILVLADQYGGFRFNEPNDLWIDSQGGIYFTDPAYQMPVVQYGEHVYYLKPDRSQVVRVIDDLVRPNGIVGSKDGKVLYVADHGANKIYRYAIQKDGLLADGYVEIEMGSDGLELDGSGNLYMTGNGAVRVFDPAGSQIQEIQVPEETTNVAFAGPEGNLLFVTARSAIYIFSLQTGIDPGGSTGFVLSSPEVVEGGVLPVEYTCDGASSTLALDWDGAPEGTVSYAVIMHHVAGGEDVHWYWVLYNIPANVTSLAKNSSGIGILGNNSVNERTEYAPPCSKGPGEKEYIYTVYALSAQPEILVPADQVTREALLGSIQNITLASAELRVRYTRP